MSEKIKDKKKIKTIEITKETTIEEKAIYAVADYLRSKGWSCLVGGFSGIEQDSRKYNFRLIFNFTGKKLCPKKK
jgi:hypothetical protein